MPEDRADDLQIDTEKRETLRRIVGLAGFAAPVVASFTISGLSVEKVMASESHGFFFS
jgi:hypothetical protein